MSSSSRARPLLLVAAALGGLGVALWRAMPAGRTTASVVGPAPERPAGAERAPEALVRPETASPESAPAAGPAAPPGWSAASLRGRVLETESDRPLKDIVVRVDGPDAEALGGARTDDEGRFELALTGPEELTIRALPRRGLVVREPPHAITEGERSGAEEIELRLARGTSAVVQGMVVNRRTQEGVFTVRVELSMAGTGLSESLVTDGQGNFAGEVAFPPGTLEARVVDEPPGEEVALGTFRREHLEDGMLGGPWVLEVDVGPSYLVDSTSGASLGEGFEAKIVERDPNPRFAAVLGVTERGFQLEHLEEILGFLDGPNGTDAMKRLREARRRGEVSDRQMSAIESLLGSEPREWPEIPVRPGSPPWIRYPRQVHEPLPADQPRETSLVVQGGGGWVGEARIDQIVGHYPFVIGIPLRACGSLGGRMVETTGEPVSRAHASLFPLGAGALALLETETDGEGGFSFTGVDVGRYRLVIEPLLHAGATREVRIDLGSNSLEPIIVPPAPIAGDVAGELFVPARTPHERPFLTMASSEGSSWRQVAVARSATRDERGTLYTFRFRDVPSGSYDLSVGQLGMRGGLSSFWVPRRQRVYPPRQDLVFECRASEDPEKLAFRVVDGKGEPVPYADVVFGPEGWLLGHHELRGDRPFVVPRGVALEWTVGARGYRSVHGTEADARRDDDVRLIEVRLDRGWSATLFLRAVSREDMKGAPRFRELYEEDLYWSSLPVRNAKVYADGDFVGRSDRDGRIDLSLPVMPEIVGIELDGWTGFAVQEASRERDEITEAVLWLTPAPR